MRAARLLTLLAAAFIGPARSASGAPELAPLFQDHAVLQRDRPIPVWGTASPGEHVTVAFVGQAVGTTAGPDGRWITFLAAAPANPSGADLTVSGRTTVTVRDVVVGEVWLCAGQSEMELGVDEGPAFRVDNAAAEAAAARYPLIRQFKVARMAAAVPMDSAGGAWSVCSPESVHAFSAVGYFFARDLFNRLHIPIGIIHCAWAGTPLEAWMSPAALAAYPGPARPSATADPRTPASVFNGMVHPLLPYALRGVIWYGGEADAARPADYGARFPGMIAAWRAHFGQGDLPFLWVQLANYAVPGDPTRSRWAFLREAQSRALALPSTGEAVAIDIGEAGNPHPRNKREVGRRLALIAKARAYGIPVDCTGPVFEGVAAEGPSLRVRFSSAGEGLTASGRPLQSFEVAGADRVFRPAIAVIEGSSVVVRSPAVAHPVAVRYAWRNAPDANLYNGAGLPAAPFRSDAW